MRLRNAAGRWWGGTLAGAGASRTAWCGLSLTAQQKSCTPRFPTSQRTMIYTAPIHGFKDAEDYWRQCSCKPFLKNIHIPTLLVSARNDPFLADACYPIEEAKENHHLYLEMPASGGHVGFIGFKNDGEYWSE